MNNFDFDIYDYSDIPPNSPTPQLPVAEQKAQVKNKAAPEVISSFDFDAYDVDQSPSKPTSSPKGRIKNPFETAPVSKEDYEKMSLREKMQYAQDLDKEQRFRRSEDIDKNIASSLSFGFSEDIPGLERSEDEDPAAAFLGQAIGSTAPILGASKLVGIPLKQLPKVLHPLANFLQVFGTGATYETAQQGANVARGQEFDPYQIPITGATFATVDKLIRGAGALGKKFFEFSPSHQAQIIEQRIIPKDLPKSQYQTAEEILDLINSQKALPEVPPGGGPTPPPSGPGSPLNPNRVRAAGEDLGLRPTPTPQNASLQDRVGDIFSPNRFYNTTQGGQAFRNEIMNIDENVYRGVNDLYRRSKELNSAINEIHPQLVNRIQSRVAELEAIPEPSDVQARVIKSSNNILKKLASFDQEGNPTGFLPISNQVLIDQIQSLRQIIDYDFAHGNTKNIFRPLINDIQDSALRAAETSGTPEAAEALNEAKNAYRHWVEAFDNDYVRPFRDSSNQDYSKLFKSSLDLDESNMLRNILSLTPRGQELANGALREIVDKNLSKFFSNPRDYTLPEFNKALRELEAVISPEQAGQIKELFRKESQSPEFKITPAKKRQPTNDEKIASRYEGKKPEDIQKMMNSRSGIKELRKDLSDTPVKKQVFERLQQQKMRSILREGNIVKDFTGDDLYKFLNKETNYELFSEFLGEQETENLRQAAKEVGKKQMDKESRNKGLKTVAKHVGTYKTIELILNLF